MTDKKIIFPKKLQKGSHIRVISAARSLKIISPETRAIADERFNKHGFSISYGKNAEEVDAFVSSSVESRLLDLHEAFADSSVDAILTTIGGYNSNELLDYVDYDLIKKNPKILCGFSDITALANAIFTKTGVVTYSGTHYSSWGMQKGFEFSEEYFLKCCANNDSFKIYSSGEWSDDAWYLDQENREFIPNTGYQIINRGNKDCISGRIIGGNLGLLNILQGTQYFPNLSNSILFLEHCAEEHELLFNRGIQALIHQEGFSGVRAIVIGRFQKDNKMNNEILSKMIKSKKELENILVLSNIDFGHTTPIITFPIGGEVSLSVHGDSVEIEMKKF